MFVSTKKDPSGANNRQQGSIKCREKCVQCSGADIGSMFGPLRLSYPSSIIAALEKAVTPLLVVPWDL